ncbi:MAG: hypothetical protein HKN78_11335 [Sphingomonadaceae bacterium]|nr:hypothetical protein [Sphingomonadaceae bacterium]
MDSSSVSTLWLRGSLVWLLAAMGIGLYLGITQQFHFSSAHAHAGLLGGVWAGLLSYGYWRAGGDKPVAGAGIAWLLFNISVAFHVFALFKVMAGNPAWGMILGVNGMAMTAITLWIVTPIWRRLV